MVRHFWANKPLWMLVSLACLRAGSLRQRGLGAEGPGQASSVVLGQLAARPRGGSGGRRAWPHGLSALCLVSGPPEIHSCFRTTLPAQPPRPRATERDGEQTWGCQRKISGTGPPNPRFSLLSFVRLKKVLSSHPLFYTHKPAPPSVSEAATEPCCLFSFPSTAAGAPIKPCLKEKKRNAHLQHRGRGGEVHTKSQQ